MVKDQGKILVRTRFERKHNTWKKIKRKLEIIKNNRLDLWSDIGAEFVSEPHRLAKDRLEDRRKKHTNNKTKRHQYANYQKSRNYKKRDQVQIDAGNYDEVINCLSHK